MPFVDEINLTVKSGKGGIGLASFASSRRKMRGGPNGGDGGGGGNVLFKASAHLDSLSHLNSREIYEAENGRPGEVNRRGGRRGKDLIIEVPLNTHLIDDQKEVLLKESADNYLFIKGGRGGKGNTHFKTSINQSPTKTSPVETAQTKKIKLEVRYPANLALMSLELVDSSSLIEALSSKKQSSSTRYLETPLLRYSSFGLSFVELPRLKNSSVLFLKHTLSASFIIQLLSFESVEKTLKDVCKIKEILSKYNSELINKNHLLFLTKDKSSGESSKEEVIKKLEKQNLKAFFKTQLLMECIKKYG